MAGTMLTWRANASSLNGTENSEKVEMLMETFGDIERVRMAEVAIRTAKEEYGELQYEELLGKIQGLVESLAPIGPGPATRVLRFGNSEDIPPQPTQEAPSPDVEQLKKEHEKMKKQLEGIRDEGKGKGD